MRSSTKWFACWLGSLSLAWIGAARADIAVRTPHAGAYKKALDPKKMIGVYTFSVLVELETTDGALDDCRLHTGGTAVFNGTNWCIRANVEQVGGGLLCGVPLESSIATFGGPGVMHPDGAMEIDFKLGAPLPPLGVKGIVYPNAKGDFIHISCQDDGAGTPADPLVTGPKSVAVCTGSAIKVNKKLDDLVPACL